MHEQVESSRMVMKFLFVAFFHLHEKTALGALVHFIHFNARVSAIHREDFELGSIFIVELLHLGFS